MFRILVLRILIALFAAAALAMGIWPAETAYLRALLFHQRHGCSLAQGLASIPTTTRLYRTCAWLRATSHVVQRDAAGYVRWQTPVGTYWAPDKDDSIFMVLAELEQDPYELAALGRCRNAVVLDCGAHLGLYTRKALEAGARLVVAIDPGAKQMACIRRNFSAEIAAGRVVPSEKGLWDSEGRLVLHSNADTAVASLMFVGPGDSSTVPVTTIDRMTAELKLPRVDLIKMDIEGAEQQALAGARDTLARFKPRLAIAGYHRPDDPQRIPLLVRAANPGYRMEYRRCRLDLEATQPLTMFFY